MLRINRIRLEFKEVTGKGQQYFINSINRIRLEFKAPAALNHLTVFTCINRIRLEFKVVERLKSERRTGVLIESDWNLKEPSPDPNPNPSPY